MDRICCSRPSSSPSALDRPARSGASCSTTSPPCSINKTFSETASSSRDQLREFMAPLRKEAEARLERAVAAKLPHVSGSCADILAHRPALWMYVDGSEVEPTNKDAEAGAARIGTVAQAFFRHAERARKPRYGSSEWR